MILRLAIILMIIASIAAGGLALLNTKTAPIIAEIKRIEQEQARKEVVATLADSIRFEEVRVPLEDDPADTLTYWRAYGENGDHLGYAGLAFGKGYSSTIETVCGFDTEFNIAGLKVTFQQETPGLGTKIVLDSFLGLFHRISALTVAVVQDRGTIDSVTGATISSRAVANSVRDVAMMIQTADITFSESLEFASDDLDESGEFYDEESGSDNRMGSSYVDEESEVDSFTDEEAE